MIFLKDLLKLFGSSLEPLSEALLEILLILYLLLVS